MTPFFGKNLAGTLIIASLFACPCFGQSRGTFIDNESNVREGPDTKSKIVLQSKAGRTFDILETSGKWFKLRLDDGTTGWTNKINIKILADAPDSPPSSANGDSPEIKRWQDAVKKNGTDPVAKFMLGIAYLDGNNKNLANGEVEKLQPLNQELAKDLKKMIDEKGK